MVSEPTGHPHIPSGQPLDIRVLVGYQPQPLTLWLLAWSWQAGLRPVGQADSLFCSLMNGFWQQTAMFWLPVRAVPHLKHVHCLSQLAWGRGFRSAFCCWLFYTQTGSLFALGIPMPSPSLSGCKGLVTKKVPPSAWTGLALLVHSSKDFVLPVFCGSSPCFSYLGLNLNVTLRR